MNDEVAFDAAFERLLDVARDAVRDLRDTADRLERAVRKRDLGELMSIQFNGRVQSLDWIRGMATALTIFRRSASR